MFKSSHLPETPYRTLSPALSLAALCAGIALCGLPLAAQTVAAPTVSTPAVATPSLALQTPAIDTSRAALFSSSAAETAADGNASGENATVATLHPTAVNFADLMQYGGGQRSRYGRPRYRGGNTNPDGSPKYTFFAGVGFTQPLGNTFKYLTPSYGFQIGGGRNFNKNLGVMLQFDYDHFGFSGATLSNQTNIYNSVFGAGTVSGLDGSSHVWSFSVDPVYTLFSGEGLGAYVVVGAGFYHKTANFTEPTTEAVDYFGIIEQFEANQTIDKYTSNAPGFNGGFGLTYKFSRFSNERLYGEVRYVFVDNSQRTGIVDTAKSIASANVNTTDFYPANSNRTTYIPVKFGIRF